MTCPRCKAEPGIENFNAPPTPRSCAFPEGVFVTGNWNCVTMNMLRDVCAGHARELYFEDEWVHVLEVDWEDGTADMPEYHSGFLVLQTYKRRGRCTGATFMHSEHGPLPLTQELAEKILDEFDVDGTRGGRR